MKEKLFNVFGVPTLVCVLFLFSINNNKYLCVYACLDALSLAATKSLFLCKVK